MPREGRVAHSVVDLGVSTSQCKIKASAVEVVESGR